ncbi:MAG: hypothetical protein ACHQT9_01235 [Candidatus Saccharimonadales bacterium]
MKRTSITKLNLKGQNRIIVGLFVALLVAAIGAYLLTGSHAATSYVGPISAAGTVGCNASVQKDPASGNGYVKFGSGTSCNGGGGGSSMYVSLVDGGQFQEAKDAGLKIIRFDPGSISTVANFRAVGVKTLILYHGPYNQGGVAAEESSFNSNGQNNGATNWANSFVSEYQQKDSNNNPYCDPTQCPVVEILNEPTQGTFWGGGHNDQNDANAYAALVEASYTAFHNAYGSSAPKILASYDGGQDASLQWGHFYWNSNVASYVDGITIHPYGGTDSGTKVSGILGSGLGNRSDVTTAHAETGKPVWVTEVGWPTDNGTGDSIQWPLQNSNGGIGDQCNNVYNFMEWSKSLGYVSGVFIYGSLGNYGVATSYPENPNNDPNIKPSIKPSFNALKASAAGQSNPCPGPLSYPLSATWNQ